MAKEKEIFPDSDWIENLGRATDPVLEKVIRLTVAGKILWKKEIDIEDQYYYAIVGTPPNTFKLEFQGTSFNVDQHSFVLWRKQLKPIQADQMRFAVRNAWKNHETKKRQEFQELLAEMTDGEDKD